MLVHSRIDRIQDNNQDSLAPDMKMNDSDDSSYQTFSNLQTATQTPTRPDHMKIFVKPAVTVTMTVRNSSVVPKGEMEHTRDFRKHIKRKCKKPPDYRVQEQGDPQIV